MSHTEPMDRLQTVAEKQYAKRRELLKEQREIEKKLELVNLVIAELEAEMSEADKALFRQKQPGDSDSIRVLIEKILESRSVGLKSSEIAEELERLGHHSRAKDPVANVDSTMYRHRPNVFVRGKDGRWRLAKNIKLDERTDSQLRLVRKLESGEA